MCTTDVSQKHYKHNITMQALVVKATEITGKDVKLQPYATSVMIVNAMKEVEKLVNSHCKLRSNKA